MSQDSRLKWIEVNSARRDPVQRVGVAVERMVEQATRAGAEEVGRVATIVAGLVDDDFRRCCRLVYGEGGVVVVNVDHPTLVQQMRQRWLVPLREALVGRSTQTRVRRIVFAYGEVGVVPEGRATGPSRKD